VKSLTGRVGEGLSKLLLYLSYFNLRALVLLLGVFWAVTPLNSPQTPNVIDQQLLKVRALFVSKPQGSSGIGIVEVPAETFRQWNEDIHDASEMSALLANILSASQTQIGLLLNTPLEWQGGAAERLIDALALETENSAKSTRTRKKNTTNEPTSVHQQINGFVHRKNLLLNLLDNPRVVIGVRNAVFLGQKPLTGTEVGAGSKHGGSYQTMLPSVLLAPPVHLPALIAPFQQWWLPECRHCERLQGYIEVARPRVDQYTLLPRPVDTYQWMLRLGGDQSLYRGFTAEFLARIGVTDVPLSFFGDYIALAELRPVLFPKLDRIALDEALARGKFPPIILIGSVDDPQLTQIATTLYSAQQGQVLRTPWWGSVLLKLVWLVLAVYLFFVAARAAIRTGVVLGAIILICFVVLQLALSYFQQIWLPLGGHMGYLLAGHLVIAVWRFKQVRLEAVMQRADKICMENAGRLIKRDKLDRAVAALKDCSTRTSLLNTLYKIAEKYIEQKQYTKAISVLELIGTRKKGFKDAQQKIEVLKSMAELTLVEAARPLVEFDTITHEAVVIPEEIGRYQIQGELGRGAMGVVYLGFDPRISRRVAIKTLQRKYLRGSSEAEVKERFFREAEAAGRLNHPNIVSVFDAGEACDMEFIAMDFAEGNALNAFVGRVVAGANKAGSTSGDTADRASGNAVGNKSTLPAKKRGLFVGAWNKKEQDVGQLLPVYEVYRIVCDVAKALAYAHAQQIIHRDIKPGNIIYHPSPYSVKVTDFGIARLMDHAKTSTGEIIGSPLYMAPEQLQGKSVSYAVDIFSLGVTFYQLLTGRLPFDGDNLAALTYNVIHTKHKNIRGVRPGLPASAARIINHALQKNVDDRYESAEEFALVMKKAIQRDFAEEARSTGYL